MPLERHFAIPAVRFELPYSTWSTSDAKDKLGRMKKLLSSLEFSVLKQKAQGPNADFAFFHCVAESVRTEQNFRTADVACLFTEHIAGLLGRDPLSDLTTSLQVEPRPWEAPIYGLLNLLEDQIEKEKNQRDPRVLEVIVSSLSALTKVVWQDLIHLLHDGTIGDHRRCLVSRILYMMSHLPGQRGKMYDNVTIAVVMHCWTYMSPNPVYRISAAACARHLFFQTEIIPPPPLGSLQRALQSVSIDTFLAREAIVLADSALVGEPLIMEFKALDPLTGQNADTSQAFVDRKFYKHIIDAVYRQVLDLESKQKYDDDTMMAFNEGDRLIRNILEKQSKARQASRLLYDMVANTRVIRVASVGFTLAAITPEYHGDWLYFFRRFREVANPTIPPRKGWLYYPINNILDEIRNSLRHIYHNTTTRLVQGNASQEYMTLWSQLGTAYMIEGHDDLTRQFFRGQKRCCNLQCFKATYESSRLKKCRICQDTFYCGKECQKFDWIEHHKEACRRGGAAAEVDEDFLDVMPPKRFVFPAED